MSYNIGQMRRSDTTNYSSDINYRKSTIINDDTEIVNFYDVCLYLTGANVLTSLYSYYIKFKVKQRADSVQDFTLKLKSSEVTIEDEQDLKIYKVAQGTDYTTYELIFTPNSTYDELVFELKRLSLDFYLENTDGTTGRIMDIQIENFTRLNNIVKDYLSKRFSGLKVIKKIGIQGPPGLLLSINEEEIRIGRTGIYELYHEKIEISSICFVLKDSNFTQDGKDFFILDFYY